MKKNNINDVLSLIKAYNEKLLLDKDNNKEIIDILDRMGNNEKLTEEERKKVFELFPDIEEMMKRVYVINQLSERGFILDDDQVNLLNQFLNINSSLAEKIEKDEDLILVNDEILEKFESNEHIDSSTLEMLKSILLDKNNLLDLSSKIKIIEEIIKHNANCKGAGKKSESTDSVVEEHINKKLLSEEDLINLLSEYNYDYDALDDDSKLYLRKHCKIDNARSVLDTLVKYGVKLKMAIDYGDLKEREMKSINTIFCKILAYSNPSIINSVEKDFENYEEVNFKDFIIKYPNVLIPGIKGSSKGSIGEKGNDTGKDSTEGEFNNYKENKEFFISKNYNFETILKTVPTVLLANSNYIRTNYEVLEKVYNISFIDSKVKKDGLYEPKSIAALISNPDILISNIDKYIESSIKGYEYVQNNPTIPRDLSSKIVDVYRIRIAEKEGKSAFYDLGKRGVVRYSAQTAKDEELKTILKMNLNEAREYFDPYSKDSDGNWIPRQLFDEETTKKYKLLVTDRKDITKEWDKDDQVLGNEYISYLENNCRVENSSPAYDFIYDINGTIISRKKVLRVFGQLLNPEVTDKLNGYKTIVGDDMIKFAISYDSILNEEDVKNIEEVVKKMNNSLAKVKSLTGGRDE